jgi:hypothetical protein
MTSLNIPSGKESEDLPYLYWIPKLQTINTFFEFVNELYLKKNIIHYKWNSLHKFIVEK